MPSSHSGYLELKLETGRIGYWIFLVLSSPLAFAGARKPQRPMRAVVPSLNRIVCGDDQLLDFGTGSCSRFLVLYLIVVAESVRFVPGRGASPAPAAAVRTARAGPETRGAKQRRR